jgi:hypothetical protein
VKEWKNQITRAHENGKATPGYFNHFSQPICSQWHCNYKLISWITSTIHTLVSWRWICHHKHEHHVSNQHEAQNWYLLISEMLTWSRNITKSKQTQSQLKSRSTHDVGTLGMADIWETESNNDKNIWIKISKRCARPNTPLLSLVSPHSAKHGVVHTQYNDHTRKHTLYH